LALGRGESKGKGSSAVRRSKKSGEVTRAPSLALKKKEEGAN